MSLYTVQDIERAINALSPQELEKLYAWLDEHRPAQAGVAKSVPTFFEQGLGLFASPEDAALLDEVVEMAYTERRRPSARTVPMP
jgi:hypothetical protein